VTLSGAVLRAVLPRPRLWTTALRVAGRTARRDWWRRPPFLPLPSRDYVRFRMQTNYGEAGATPTVDDVVDYLSWCRDFPNRNP
jgi:hypothetical protein